MFTLKVQVFQTEKLTLNFIIIYNSTTCDDTNGIVVVPVVDAQLHTARLLTGKSKSAVWVFTYEAKEQGQKTTNKVVIINFHPFSY